MSSLERQMLVYLKLAVISQEKRQQLGRDKFLVLTAASSCREGLLKVAERCREIVLRTSPSHILSKAENIPSFLKNEEFAPFLRAVEKFCNFEQAEHLLENMGIDLPMQPDISEQSVGKFAMEMLRGPVWDVVEPGEI